MKHLPRAVLVAIACVLVGGWQDGEVHFTRDHHDKFAKYPANDDPEQWCLNNSITVLKPEHKDTWLSVGKVELERIGVQSNCTPEDIFGEKWEFKLHESGAKKHGFTIKYNSDIKHQDLHIEQGPDGLPFWVHRGLKFHHYVMLSEARNSAGDRVKYYRIETFRANETNEACNRERPDFVDEATGYRALVKVADGGTCPSGDPPIWPMQTGVSGGGEGK